MLRIGIDTGGTFTDFAFYDGKSLRIHKVPSTPDNPSKAIISGLHDVLGDDIGETKIVHGTTVGTNALLERKGARVALVTTAGFEDVIEIGRQNREKLYDFFHKPVPPLISREMRFGVNERTTFDGEILKEVGEEELSRLKEILSDMNVECVAISLLHSYANSHNEEVVKKMLSSLNVPITVSSAILPEFREYERTSTVVVNSYLTPKVKSYMNELETELRSSKVHIMQSSGGVLNMKQAAEEPVRLIMSGPAGGVVGGFKVAEAIGIKNLLTYDMGGTSTDVALTDGALKFTTETTIDGLPIKIPMIDVRSIGAGGGSLVYIDSGGALKVGPKSAGAYPGPACYGNAGEPTVTDANVALGRIRPEWFLGGRMKINPEYSYNSVSRIAEALKTSVTESAEGIIKVSNSNMERALRVISIGRGYDPREFTLMSFGGAGGLHACDLAFALGITQVVFPVDPGAFSALGMLMADSFKDYGLTYFISSEDEDVIAKINSLFKELEDKALMEFRGERITFKRFLDVRYRRQSHEITVPYSEDFRATFDEEHKKYYGYNKLNSEVEVVTLRLRGIIGTSKLEMPELLKPKEEFNTEKVSFIYDNKQIEALSYRRDDLYEGFKFSGPSLVLESTSTILIPPGFDCKIDRFGNLTATIH